MIEEHFLSTNFMENMNKQNIFDDLLRNMNKRVDSRRIPRFTESNFLKILEEKVEIVERLNNELNGSKISFKKKVREGKNIKRKTSHKQNVESASPLARTKDIIFTAVLPEIHHNARNTQIRVTIKNKMSTIKKFNEPNVIEPIGKLGLGEFCLTVTEPNEDQNQTAFNKTPVSLLNRSDKDLNIKHSKLSAYRKSISCRDVTSDKVKEVENNRDRRISQGNLNPDILGLSYFHKADQDGVSIQHMISQLNTRQSHIEPIRNQTPVAPNDTTAINYNNHKKRIDAARKNTTKISRKSRGDKNDIYSVSKFARVNEESLNEPDLDMKAKLIFTETMSEFMKSVPHNLHKEAQQFLKLFRAKLEKNSQIRNGIAITANPSTLIPGSILDKIYTTCKKEFNISSEIERVLNLERNRSLSKNNIKKFEKLDQQDFLSEILSSKEKNTTPKVFLYNKTKDPSNIDISKISNNLAYLNRKFFVDRYGYNYNHEPDFIFRDLCNDDSNDNYNSNILLKAEEKRNKKHLLVENYLDSTMKKKKELITHLSKNMPRKVAKIVVKTLPPIKIK